MSQHSLPTAFDLHAAAEAHVERTATFNLRAVFVGAIVNVAGSLVMTTVVGVTAIVALLSRGVEAETITAELPHSDALVVFTTISGLLMSITGGYTAATISQWRQLRYALAAGFLSTVLNLLLLMTLGFTGPVWLTGVSLVGIMPCALVGGWLAMPRAA